jgi:hypothetical protein
MVLVFTGDLPGWTCGWVTSRRGLAREKKRLRAFGDRLSVEPESDDRKGIVKAKAAPMSRMVNREKGRGIEEQMISQVLDSHLVSTFLNYTYDHMDTWL